ncbi:MAG: hypothetical protein HY925_10625, partial [Elusimicrobia bacterium]|nr:hypothetical protein [Elusimicrobiota bacterium]
MKIILFFALVWLPLGHAAVPVRTLGQGGVSFAPAWTGSVGRLFQFGPAAGIRWEGGLQELSHVDFAQPGKEKAFGRLAIALESLGHTPESFAKLPLSLAAKEASRAMPIAESRARSGIAIRLWFTRLEVDRPDGEPERLLARIEDLVRDRAEYEPYLDARMREEVERVRVDGAHRYQELLGTRILESASAVAERLRPERNPEQLVDAPSPRAASALLLPGLLEPFALARAREDFEDAWQKLGAAQSRLAASPRVSASELAEARHVLSEIEHNLSYVERRVDRARAEADEPAAEAFLELRTHFALA